MEMQRRDGLYIVGAEEAVENVVLTLKCLKRKKVEKRRKNHSNRMRGKYVLPLFGMTGCLTYFC